jgi:hypothetical protein
MIGVLVLLTRVLDCEEHPKGADHAIADCFTNWKLAISDVLLGPGPIKV